MYNKDVNNNVTIMQLMLFLFDRVKSFCAKYNYELIVFVSNRNIA